jgi:hypothetical protein
MDVSGWSVESSAEERTAYEALKVAGTWNLPAVGEFPATADYVPVSDEVPVIAF